MKSAVLLGFSYRLSQLLAQGLLVILSPFFLSAGKLGYFFTMLALASSQSLFELGLGQVLLVFLSHIILDSSINHIRNNSEISLLYKTSQILYSIISILFFLIGGLLGFFLLNSSGSLPKQAWLPPWILLCLLISLNIINNNKLLYIESTGREKSVFIVRTIQYLSGAIIYILFLSFHFDLWSVCAIPLGCILTCNSWLSSKNIAPLFDFKCNYYSFRCLFSYWKTKLLPLQLKTSLSYLSGFISLQLFIPLVFRFYGPQAAADVGFSVNIITGITLLAASFSTANARRFASYAKSGNHQIISRLFKHALLFTFLLSITSMIAGIILLPKISYFSTLTPNISIFIIICLGGLSNSITYCYAIYLRSYLREPLLVPSVIAAIMSLTSFIAINSTNLFAFVTAYSFSSIAALIISTFITYSHYNYHGKV